MTIAFQATATISRSNHVSSAYTDSCFANQKKASTLICNSAHRIMCALCLSHLNKALHHGDHGTTSAPKKEVALKPIDFQEM
jgi:hypothetical protein